MARKTALITGGSRGIGLGIARALAAEQCDLAINGVRPEEQVDTLESLRATGTSVVYCRGDVSDAQDRRRIIDQARDAFGRLDVLVNNAAEQHEVKDFTDLAAEQLERTFRTNVFGYFFMTKAALEHLPDGGAIVNTTSITAYQGYPSMVDYASTRGAIVAFTRSMSKLLVDRKIRVNAVAPGPIWTPLIPASFPPEKVAEHGGSAPMGRAGQPNEVAACHVFLASEEASYMSGQVLHPNGGTIVQS